MSLIADIIKKKSDSVLEAYASNNTAEDSNRYTYELKTPLRLSKFETNNAIIKRSIMLTDQKHIDEGIYVKKVTKLTPDGIAYEELQQNVLPLEIQRKVGYLGRVEMVKLHSTNENALWNNSEWMTEQARKEPINFAAQLTPKFFGHIEY